jgi:hypothetical protein
MPSITFDDVAAVVFCSVTPLLPDCSRSGKAARTPAKASNQYTTWRMCSTRHGGYAGACVVLTGAEGRPAVRLLVVTRVVVLPYDVVAFQRRHEVESVPHPCRVRVLKQASY